jgi:hypothetical protein
LFVGHSPYYSLFNEELSKASEKIPMPTGNEISIDEKSSTFKKYADWITVRHTGLSEEVLDEADKLLLDVAYMDTTASIDGGFIVLNFRKNGEVKVSFDLTTVKKIENLIKLLKEPAFGIGDVEATVKDFNTWNSEEAQITEEQLESINK